MAVLGFNIVVTLIAASILQKLSARFSFGRRILSNGLFRYLHPTVEELKSFSGKGEEKGGGGRRRKATDSSGGGGGRNGERKESEGFLIPKDTPIPLQTAPVTSIDVLQLPYYAQFRWMIDFGVCTCGVYGVTEVYRWAFPLQCLQEINLSLVWCTVLIFLALKGLCSLSAPYFRSSETEGGERSLVLMLGALVFLLSMVFLLFVDSAFDVGLQAAHTNFTRAAGAYLQEQEVDVSKYQRQSNSPIMMYLILSLLFGLLGGILVFPCFRYATMYSNALEYAKEQPLTRLILHGSFFAPALVILLWTRPLALDHLAHSEEPVLTEQQVHSLRLWMSLGAVLLRYWGSRECLQAYLNLAHERIAEMNKEGGKINSLEVQRMVARIFFYLCGAALQLFIPVVLCLALTFILKSSGNYSWLTCWGLTETPLPLIGTSKAPGSGGGWMEGLGGSLLGSLFNPVVMRGVWGLGLLALHLLTFTLSCVGVFYHSKFPTH